MLLVSERSPVDGELHQQNIALLNALQAAPDLATLRFYLRTVAETDDTLQLLPSSGGLTKTFIVSNPVRNQLTICVGGMDNTFAQVSRCLDTWASASAGPNAFNTYQEAAGTIAASVPPIAGGWNDVRIIGHSYGGAVSMWLPLQIPVAKLNNPGIKQIYTYGAPKAFNQGADFISGAFVVRRCFQNNDPVPSLPVGSSDVGSVWPYVGVSTARAWNRWTQKVSGLAFDGQGHMLASSNPTLSAQPTLFYLTLASWLSGVNCFAADGHSLASYTQACAIVFVAPTFTSAPVTQRIRRAPDPTVQEVTRQRDEELAIIGTNVSANPGGAAVGIQSGIVLTTGVRYRGVKISGVNWVVYGDQLVTPTKTLRSRRALVRYLNRTI